MCGIVGAVNWGDREVLDVMTAVQKHRGPDDSGTWEAITSLGWVGLGSRRLSILDLSPAGHMPMSTPDGSVTIVYNGEIYNCPELRRELQQLGYQLRSTGDTEAILYLYQHYGPECVKRLVGMFAIAIWDDNRQQLFLARDHFGVKPLYYVRQHNRFAFASEMKALMLLPGFERKLNYEALNQYLTFLWVPDPLTAMEGVYKLPAGHYAILRNGDFQVQEYWDLQMPPDNYTFGGDERTLAVEVRERLFASVKRNMLSDVPVGAFLSAGLDSSSIVAGMARATGAPVHTYTITFPKTQLSSSFVLDDANVARDTAKKFGCEHTEIEVTSGVVDLLPRLTWHMDEPVADPAIITAFLVNKAAREHSTVLLSGIGGDELFGGYRKYLAHYLARYYRAVPGVLRNHLIAPLLDALPARGGKLKQYLRLARKMVRSGSLPPRERFIRDCVYLDKADEERFVVADLAEHLGAYQAGNRHWDRFNRVPNADFLNQMLYLDLKIFMVSLNLNYNDKMSMASSVEVRVPFLDWQMSEWLAWNLSPKMKINGGKTKYILRKAMSGILSDAVLQQPKAGFGAPVDHWLSTDLREMIDDILSETSLKNRGFLNPRAVRAVIEEQRRGSPEWSPSVWQFLTLELWMRTFIDASQKDIASMPQASAGAQAVTYR